MSNEMYSALQILRDEPVAAKVFEKLKKSTLSGWDLSRQLGVEPEDVIAAVSKLKKANVIDSRGGDGLAGIYYITDVGYQLRLIRAA